MRKVIDVAADIRRWTTKAPDVDDARADLQRAMGKLVFAHTARLAHSGNDPSNGPTHAIVDVLEALCVAAHSAGDDPRALVGALELVLEQWAKGKASP